MNGPGRLSKLKKKLILQLLTKIKGRNLKNVFDNDLLLLFGSSIEQIVDEGNEAKLVDFFLKHGNLEEAEGLGEIPAAGASTPDDNPEPGQGTLGYLGFGGKKNTTRRRAGQNQKTRRHRNKKRRHRTKNNRR